MRTIVICDETRFEAAPPFAREHKTGIEVQTFYQPHLLENNLHLIEQHRSALTGIQPLSLHGPFGDLCPGSFDPEVRNLARKRYRQGLAVAEALDIDHVVLHHGYVPGTSFRKNWIERLTQFWKDFLSDQRADLQIHLENHLETDPMMMAEMIDAVGDPRLSLCLDIGHVHCFAKADAVEWIKLLGDRIRYVHLHDNDGGSDAHQTLGAGTIPLRAVLAALEENSPEAIWAVEADFSTMEQSLDWLAVNGYR